MSSHTEENTLFRLLVCPVLLFALLVCLSMFVDYPLATERSERLQDVEKQTYYEGGSRYSTGNARAYFRYTTERGTFESSEELLMGSSKLIKRTPLWRTAVSERNSTAENPVPISMVYSGLYPLRIALLVAAAGFGLMRRFDINLRKGASLLASVLLFLILYQLLKGSIF